MVLCVLMEMNSVEIQWIKCKNLRSKTWQAYMSNEWMKWLKQIWMDQRLMVLEQDFGSVIYL